MKSQYPRVARQRTIAIMLVATALAVVAVSSGTPGATVLHSRGVTNKSVVTTYDYNNRRTGNGGGAPISGLSNQPLWNRILDGAVYGEPLLYRGLVIVATENDTVYGLNPTDGSVAWHLHVGTAVSTTIIDQATGLYSSCGNINPLGITGTPVIDPSTNTIYVAEETMRGATSWRHIRHVLVAISMVTHREIWSRVIDPPGGNTPSQYTIAALQQRPALTLANGRVYVNFGGLAGDCGLYHGYIVGAPATGVGPDLVYKVPTRSEGAIWATNGALVDSVGNLYVATGNGAGGVRNFDQSDAIVKLTPTLQVLGTWAPTNWQTLSKYDWDLGSAGPIFIPNTALLFAAGKPSNGSFGFIVWSDNLGSGPASALFTGQVCSDNSSGVFGANASAVVNVAGVPTIFIYSPCGNGTEAIKVTLTPNPQFSQAWGPNTTSTNGPPIVAGGVVWSLDFNGQQLAGLDPATGAVIVTRSTEGLNHFATPTVGDGLIIIPTSQGTEAYLTM